MEEHNGKGNIEVRTRQMSEAKGRFEVTAVAHELGNDCLVVIYGGTIPHIGAVAMGQVRPSLKDPNDRAATSSVFTLCGPQRGCGWQRPCPRT